MGEWDEFNGATVIVQRRNRTGTEASTNEPIFDDAHPTVLYSGSANVYDVRAEIITLSVGQVIQQKIVVIIDNVPLPTGITQGCRVVCAGANYRIDHAHHWDFDPESLEIQATLQDSW